MKLYNLLELIKRKIVKVLESIILMMMLLVKVDNDIIKFDVRKKLW